MILGITHSPSWVQKKAKVAIKNNNNNDKKAIEPQKAATRGTTLERKTLPDVRILGITRIALSVELFFTVVR